MEADNPNCCQTDHECSHCERIPDPCHRCQRDAWRAVAEKLAAALHELSEEYAYGKPQREAAAAFDALVKAKPPLQDPDQSS
jgi:hypothetical protein